MKVWWCQEHEAQQTVIEPTPEGVIGICWKWDTQALYLKRPCRMVPMRLIPDNALDHLRDELIQIRDMTQAWADALNELNGETP